MKLSCRIHTMPQRSPEWHAIRARCVTASEIGKWIVAEPKVQLNKEEIGAILDSKGIKLPKALKSMLHGELCALLPDMSPYLGYDKIVTDARLNLICDKLGSLSGEEIPDFAEKKFAVKRGRELEPLARNSYSLLTGHDVIEVGFCEAEGYIGCSPDGLCPIGEDRYSHGAEIKCHLPKRHVKDLFEGGVPDDHIMQVHASMAVTGLDRWDYFAFCPNLPPLLATVERDATTERVLEGMRIVAEELQSRRRAMAEMWAAMIEQRAALMERASA